MRYLIASYIFLCLISQSLFAQSAMRVISTDGLKLREKPTTNSKVLAVAAFGDKVVLLSDPEDPTLVIDTMGVAFDFPTTVDSIGNWQETRQVLHVGKWLQVKFTEKTGYMFSGFLEYFPDPDVDYRYSNDAPKEMLLRYEGGDACSDNQPVFEKNWLWYGVYKRKNGFEIKRVELRYLKMFYGLSGQADYLSNGEDEEVVTRVKNTTERSFFLVGTKKPLKEKLLTYAGFDDNYHEATRIPFYLENGAPDNAFLEKINLETTKSPGIFNFDWFVKDNHGGKIPLKFAIKHQWYGEAPSLAEYHVESLVWYGDLDGDSKLDYIFNFFSDTHDDSMPQILYLSSLAKPGEVLKAAAVFFYYDCC